MPNTWTREKTGDISIVRGQFSHQHQLSACGIHPHDYGFTGQIFSYIGCNENQTFAKTKNNNNKDRKGLLPSFQKKNILATIICQQHLTKQFVITSLYVNILFYHQNWNKCNIQFTAFNFSIYLRLFSFVCILILWFYLYIYVILKINISAYLSSFPLIKW